MNHTMEALEARTPLLFRLGIPHQLRWGYLGILAFMTGLGIESNFLTPHLVETLGSTEATVSLIITSYSLAVIVGSYLSGALSDLWGPKKVMLLGFSVWIVFHIGFLLAINTGNIALVAVMYFCRGFGFPLFSFAFLVWVVVVAMRSKRSSAVGWFYVMFTGGFPTLGSLVAIGAIPAFGGGVVGETGAMWIAAGLALIGFLTVWFTCSDERGKHRLAPATESSAQVLTSGIRLLLTNSRILKGFFVRMINTAPEFGMFIIMPTVISTTLGWGQTRWLAMTVSIYASNIIFNAAFGALGDKFGWVNTVRWFGIFSSGIALLIWWYAPHWVPAGSDWGYFVAVAAGVLYGTCLAGYTPIGAMFPAQVGPEHRGAAMAMYTTAAGGAIFLGSLVVSVVLNLTTWLGWDSAFARNSAVIWTFVALYGVSFVLVGALRTDQDDPVKRAAIRQADVDSLRQQA